MFNFFFFFIQLAWGGVQLFHTTDLAMSATLLRGLLDVEINGGFGCPPAWPEISPALNKGLALLRHVPCLNVAVASYMLHAPDFVTLRQLWNRCVAPFSMISVF